MAVELIYNTKIKQLVLSDTPGAAIRGVFVQDARKEATVWVCVDLSAGGHVGGTCVVAAATIRDATTTTFAAGFMGTFPGHAHFQFPSRAADTRANFTSQ